MTRPGFQLLLSIDQQQQCTYPVRLQSQFASCSGRFSTRTMLNCGVSSSKAMESCRRSNWAKKLSQDLGEMAGLAASGLPMMKVRIAGSPSFFKRMISAGVALWLCAQSKHSLRPRFALVFKQRDMCCRGFSNGEDQLSLLVSLRMLLSPELQ